MVMVMPLFGAPSKLQVGYTVTALQLVRTSLGLTTYRGRIESDKTLMMQWNHNDPISLFLGGGPAPWQADRT